jgi:peptidoglycan/xylan/chitin deacetylase (PgdA/CDA1 family)
MYHKIDEERSDYLTVTTRQLRNQLELLAASGYQFISLQDWLDHLHHGLILPERPVLLTFDDGYTSVLSLAYPILREFRAKATVFLPTGYAGTSSSWDLLAEPLLSVGQLRRLDPQVFELALHTHRHLNYAEVSLAEMEQDLVTSLEFLRANHLLYVPALAYPYGRRPADASAYRQMLGLFRKYGIQAAFRIGNRINAAFPENLYEINRIDVRGTDSLSRFKRKVMFGRLL